MAQLKKQQRRGRAAGTGDGSATGNSGAATEAGPINSPFRAMKKDLYALIHPAPQKKAPEPPRPKPTRSPDDGPVLSDSELFYQEMSGVRQHGKSAGRERPVEEIRAVQARQSEDAEAYAQLSDLVEGIGTFDISDSDEYIEGIAPGLDRRLLLRLRRGDYSVQAHVDLHGLTREEAHIRVDQFVHEARLRSRRCVLIVHGRGLNSKDQIPVLKESVRVWLTRGKISRSVLCFATARPTDGGSGAVYVLLRK